MPKKTPSRKTKVKTEWDFSLFYKNDKDPQIEKDVEAIEKSYLDFARAYKDNKSFISSSTSLKKALEDWEAMNKIGGNWKPVMYFYYRKDINANDAYAEAQIAKYTARLTNASNEIVFFFLMLGKIPKETQERFLGDNSLGRYHYLLRTTFDAAKYDLTESEEKILNLKSQPAYNMWVGGFDKLLSKQTVLWKGKHVPITEAQNLIVTLPTKERRKLSDITMQKVREISDFAEAEINAIYTDKKINDELRGLEKPYTGTLVSHQTDEKTVMTLVETVTRYFSVSHRFYKLKAKMLGEKSLEYADRSAGVGKTDKKISFDQSCDIIRSAFGKVGHRFREIFDDFLSRGHVDVFPKKGKTGGAYCSSSSGQPTLVLLNHIPNMNSVMTFAHEMGHAFHSEFSKVQPIIYQGYSTAVAEVASTLFENFAFDEVFETLTEKEKVIALHDRLNDDISTIFRQIAFFNFELELHNEIRSKGALSKEEIAKLMNKHVQAYLGPVMKLKENDGYFFAKLSHIRRYFYVYSYAYGQIISKALYAEYKKDKKFIKKIEEFLSAGGSKSPYEIFKSIGIDTSRPEFFEAGLKQIEEDIARLEKLIK